MTEGIEHGRAEARAAAERGERVIVMSGDGLIGQVGGELAGTGCVMGIIPGGRGNDLARVLGIPNDVEEAVGLIAYGATRQIDVGEANGGRFLGIASCGFDSDANRIANESKRVKGPLVYAYAALRALAAWKPARVQAGGGRRGVRGRRLHDRGRKQQGVRRRHVHRPRRRARRRPAGPDLDLTGVQVEVPARPPRRLQRHTHRQRRGRRAAGGRAQDQRRPAVCGLCRWRPRCRTAGDAPGDSARADGHRSARRGRA